jgi:hypothetical protein
MSLEHPDISYLKSDDIGKVIAQGLSELYRERPKFPVDYLAKWLYNYSSQKEEMFKLRKLKERKRELHSDHGIMHLKETQARMQLEELREEKIRSVAKFKEAIEVSEFPDELVHSFFPQGIMDLVEELNSVYIGHYEFPPAKFDLEENDDDLAHLNMSTPRVIRYIGSNDRVKVKRVLTLGRGFQMGFTGGQRRDVQVVRGGGERQGHRRG